MNAHFVTRRRRRRRQRRRRRGAGAENAGDKGRANRHDAGDIDRARRRDHGAGDIGRARRRDHGAASVTACAAGVKARKARSALRAASRAAERGDPSPAACAGGAALSSSCRRSSRHSSTAYSLCGAANPGERRPAAAGPVVDAGGAA